MFHEDIEKPLKDTEEVESIREGQPMQSMDEQPGGKPAGQQSGHDAQDQPLQEARANEPVQETGQQTGGNLPGNQVTPRPESQVQPGESAGSYRGASEQIPFSFPPVPPYQPGPVVPYPGAQPAQSSQPTPTWAYPQRPEYYQANTSSQPLPAQRRGITQPLPTAATGQPGQLPTSSNAYGPAYQQPTAQAAPPGLFSSGPTPQPGMGAYPPPNPPRSKLRTGALAALILLLAAIFASGLVSGWALSRSNSSDANSSGANNNTFQPGKTSTVTIPPSNGNNADAVREAVIGKVQPAIVQIDVITNAQHALGSGVVIDGRGYIVTNNHVVNGANSIQVTLSDGSTYPAQVTGTDNADDLAVIKITPPASGLTVISFGDSSQLKVGQAVLAIGSPLGNSESVTSGIVSALNRNVSEGNTGPTLPDAIQTDAPINPGNSGGALVDMQGHLVGIPTLNAIDTEYNTPANGLGFAIPSNRIKNIAQQIITDGHVSHTGRAMLGVNVTSVNQSIQAQDNLSINSGALILKVNDGSPAAAAGLQANDVIVQLGSSIVHDTSSLSTALLQDKPGESVPIKIYRGSQQLTLNITLGELAAS